VILIAPKITVFPFFCRTTWYSVPNNAPLLSIKWAIKHGIAAWEWWYTSPFYHIKKKATMCGLYKTWKTMLKWLLPWKYEAQVLQSYLRWDCFSFKFEYVNVRCKTLKFADFFRLRATTSYFFWCGEREMKKQLNG
jgi:hypothetical protein